MEPFSTTNYQQFFHLRLNLISTDVTYRKSLADTSLLYLIGMIAPTRRLSFLDRVVDLHFGFGVDYVVVMVKIRVDDVRHAVPRRSLGVVVSRLP
jgi:hypothetical protein